MMPETKMAGYTVVTPNYLAHGLSLKESFLQHNPGSRFYICIIGRREDLPLDDASGFYFITSINDSRIENMLQQYTPFELSCAVKSFFASYIFDEVPELEHLVYLDSDILVFGRFQTPAKAAITISPHRVNVVGFLPEPLPLSDTSLNRFGVFNAGYFEVMRQDEGMKFLEWWKQVVSTMCYNKPDEHLFADQLWLNCVPAFFENVSINRHPGYNLAYWNLIERTLTESNGAILVNNEPLIFFHYSHYRFESPEKMTSFENEFLSFSKFPLLRPLFRQYESGAIRNGYHQYKSLPYPFAAPEGVPKKGFLKKLFTK